jgi:hypothetical protein
MSGGAPDKRGTLVEVPVVLSMDQVGLRRRVKRPPLPRTWWACAKRRRGRSLAGLFSLLMAADHVLAFKAGGDV